MKYEDLQNLVFDLQDQLKDAKDDIDSLQAAVAKSNNNRSNVVADQLFDEFWRGMFYWNSFFEAVTAYTQTGTVTADGSKVLLTTGGTSGNQAYIIKTPANNGNLKFSVRVFFRTTFQMADVSSNTTYLVVGRALNSTGDQYFGFKVTGGKLYAVSSNNGTSNETAVLIGSISNATTYVVEARFYPGNKIVFFLNPTATSPNGVACITTSLPIYSETIVTNLMSVICTTNTNAARSVQFSNYEILWAKNYIN